MLKTQRPTEPNDFPLIALTSSVVKCLERLIKRYIVFQTHHLMDPLQFAYQASRGVEDAILTLMHLLHTHLEKPKTRAKILFLGFSSAFNTMLPKTLTEILAKEFHLNTGLIYWIMDFLSGRIQQVDPQVLHRDVFHHPCYLFYTQIPALALYQRGALLNR